ncbi:cytochrome c maturation protein CcmE [Cytophagaceae bacterium ABcell3]|nr:cytochrome c maturation protein CcmE [Cytophagaceae bacterium ABcell3]
MKKANVLAIVIIAISAGIIISTASTNSTYADFAKASESEGGDFTVVGSLQKGKSIEYNPSIDPNLVTFFMVDKMGNESKVVLNQSKPQDMERSEDVVVKGRMKDGVFYATTILFKCPSKYAEENEFKADLSEGSMVRPN